MANNDGISSLKTYPVAIVGGGPTGLLSSILLSQLNIRHILFEKYPSTSVHPKACGLNHRTMEIFRRIGVEPEINKQGAPKQNFVQTAWYTSFGQSGKEITRRDAWGGGALEEEYAQASPSSYVMLPQIRLEPILQKRALELNPETILYNSEVLELKEDAGHVVITFQRQGQEGLERIHAQYSIVADGGRSLTEKLGISWEGERDIVDMVSAHVKAPLSLHHPDMRSFITWFINPALGGSQGSGSLYHLGPYPMSTDTEEWLFSCPRHPTDPTRFDEATLIRRMLDTLQIPDLEVELLSMSHWYVNALCAKQYRSQKSSGRVFLVGDAAHRIPPWGALGLNTGIQDVDNLVWKLNLALKGLPPLSTIDTNFNTLLDTYDAERRFIGQRVGVTSLYNMRAHSLVLDTAIGVSPDKSVEENTAAVDSFLDISDTAGECKRRAVERAQEVLDQEFAAIGAECGWFYPELDTMAEGKATNHDGQLLENGELDLLRYHPSTIPGHNLPHVWLERAGKKVSTRDLIKYDRFTLFTSSPGSWESSCRDLDSVLTLIGVCGPDCNSDHDEHSTWRDTYGQWPSVRGVGETGAVLVRPDGIVIWRADEFNHSEHGRKDLMMDVIKRSLAI